MIELNHIGYVVSSIDDYFKKAYYSLIIKDIFDPVQKSRLALVKASGHGPIIELIEPQPIYGTTYNFLNSTGGGIHHICYQITSKQELDNLLTTRKLKKIYGPVPAVLFEGKEVIFTYSNNKEIIEFLIL